MARIGFPPLARPLIEALDRRARRPVEIARETRAEQRVDGEIGRIERNGLDRLEIAPSQALAAKSRVAAQRLDGGRAAQARRRILLLQQPRGDETVAAIVAGSAQDGDASMARRKPARLQRDRRAGMLHQLTARRPARDRQPVGLRHFGIGQQLGRKMIRRHRKAAGFGRPRPGPS